MPSHYQAADPYSLGAAGSYRYHDGVAGGGEYGRSDRGAGAGNVGLVSYPASLYSGSTSMTMRQAAASMGSSDQSYASRQSYDKMPMARSFESGISRTVYNPTVHSDFDNSASHSTYDLASRSSYGAGSSRAGYDEGGVARSSYGAGGLQSHAGYGDRSAQHPDYNGGAIPRSRFDPVDTSLRSGSSYGGGYQDSAFDNRSSYRDEQGYRGSSRDFDGSGGGAGGSNMAYNRGQGILGAWEDNAAAVMNPSARDRSGGSDGLMGRVPMSDRSPRDLGMMAALSSQGQGRSDFMGAMSQLNKMNNPESDMAFNILNSVLKERDGGARGGMWDDEPSAKLRRMDLSHKYPSTNRRQSWEGRGPQQVWDNPPSSLMAPASQSTSQYRRVAKPNRGNARTDSGRDKDKDNRRPRSEGSTWGTSKPSESSRGDSKASQESDQRLNVPSEVLQCHICDVKQFSSVQSYLRHLETVEHVETTRAFHSMCNAVQDLLLVEAKLSSIRNGEFALSSSVRCRRCNVVANLKEHNNSLEHLLVSHFMKHRCCKRQFMSRNELEDHKLSLQHYRFNLKHNFMKVESKPASEEEKAEKEKEKEQEKEKEEKEAKSLEVLEEAHRKFKENEEPVYTSATLPPYDPEKPVGLHMINRRSYYKCAVCPDMKLKLTNEMVLKTHFHSLDHHNNLEAYVMEIFTKKYLEKKAQVVKKGGDTKATKGKEEAGEEKGKDKKDESAKEEDDEVIVIEDEEKDVEMLDLADDEMEQEENNEEEHQESEEKQQQQEEEEEDLEQEQHQEEEEEEEDEEQQQEEEEEEMEEIEQELRKEEEQLLQQQEGDKGEGAEEEEEHEEEEEEEEEEEQKEEEEEEQKEEEDEEEEEEEEQKEEEEEPEPEPEEEKTKATNREAKVNGASPEKKATPSPTKMPPPPPAKKPTVTAKSPSVASKPPAKSATPASKAAAPQPKTPSPRTPAAVKSTPQAGKATPQPSPAAKITPQSTPAAKKAAAAKGAVQTPAGSQKTAATPKAAPAGKATPSAQAGKQQAKAAPQTPKSPVKAPAKPSASAATKTTAPAAAAAASKTPISPPATPSSPSTRGKATRGTPRGRARARGRGARGAK